MTYMAYSRSHSSDVIRQMLWVRNAADGLNNAQYQHAGDNNT